MQTPGMRNIGPYIHGYLDSSQLRLWKTFTHLLVVARLLLLGLTCSVRVGLVAKWVGPEDWLGKSKVTVANNLGLFRQL